jgi:ATP/maltotriose-dependent transcriptional regulator MalT
VALPAATASQPRTPASKTLPPALPAAWVDRPALLTRLDEVGARRLTTVVAGAGFGKSTLLAAWAARVPAAWYSLQPEDASLPTFLRGLVDALRLRLPNLPDELGTALAAPLGPDADELARADGFAAALGEALELRLRGDLVLVLDDVHELPAGGPPARLVEGLARHAPASFHLVLSSRTEPPFPIQRLRGRGQVLELDGGLLALDLAETGELLAATLGPDGRGLREPLHRTTGGWPAAACLAVESLRRQRPREWASSLASLHRPGGLLFAYLAEECWRARTGSCGSWSAGWRRCAASPPSSAATSASTPTWRCWPGWPGAACSCSPAPPSTAGSSSTTWSARSRWRRCPWRPTSCGRCTGGRRPG